LAPIRQKSSGGQRSKSGALIRKIRKPMAPPTRVVDEKLKYRRDREQERLRREGELPPE
jgi:hypothetical protein